MKPNRTYLKSCRRFLLKQLLFIGGGLVYSGCGRNQGSDPRLSGSVHGPLRVATYYWPGEYWIDIAKSLDWFREAGLNVEVVDTNADYFASFKDLVEGRIDINSLNLFDLMLLNAKGADLVGIATTDISNGADGIISRADISTVAGLRNKKIGLSKGTYQEFILHVVLTRQGIPKSEVSTVEVPSEKAIEEISKGSVDAAVTWEPALSQGPATGKMIKLWDTSHIPGLLPSLLTTRRKVLREREDELTKLLQVWQRCVKFIQEKPEDAYTIVARVNNKPVEDARQFVARDQILDLDENFSRFSYAAGFESLHGTAKIINNFLVTQGFTTRNMDSADMLDDKFIRGLK